MSQDRYGEWPSPITAELVVSESVSVSDVMVDGPDVWWSELRPAEGGRVQVVRRTPDGERRDLLPDGFSARTRVHEYGGGASYVDDGWLWFVNWSDQRLYRVPVDGSAAPEPITPEPPSPAAHRFADMRRLDGFVICVRERHDPTDPGHEAVNEIVAVSTDGSGEPQVLVAGPDFVANPRLSPSGLQLVWIEWDHPDMPWVSTRLRAAAVEVRQDAGGATVVLGDAVTVAGGPGESVIQPVFRDDGELHFLSDRTDWWNAHSVGSDGEVVVQTALEAEIGTPQWVFGMSRYGFLADGRMVFAYAGEGVDHLAVRDLDGVVRDLDVPYTEIASVVVRPTSVVFVGAAFDREPAVVEVRIEDGAVEVLRPARDLGLDPGWISTGRPVSFPSGTEGSRTAHALYYPPSNPDVEPPVDEVPPLLVLIHGGPTSMARARLDLAKQYWTSRGFAVVDVNYGGSTGFGRPYRELLQGQWGIVDVEDCVTAARWLAEQGLADGDRLCIRGGSAGGFTVLSALVQTDVFAAGASSYGVADLTALAEETHKFESRYLDGLIGPYPEARAVYEERSPINHVDRLESPLIVFQGLEDEVVPANQSEMVVDALRRKGVVVEYHAFEGEQHGFRKAETVIAVLEAELAFYGRVLGFTPAGPGHRP